MRREECGKIGTETGGTKMIGRSECGDGIGIIGIIGI